MKNKIRIFRATYAMTQEDLATRVGVSRQTIISVEKNRYIPSLALAFKIARAFNTNVETVFQYEEDDNEKG